MDISEEFTRKVDLEEATEDHCQAFPKTVVQPKLPLPFTNMGGGGMYWQVSTQNIAQRVVFLLESKQLTDCKFIVGTKPQQSIFEGHKLLLAMSSPVFEAMFYGNMAEKKDFIEINDIQPEAFKPLLEYIYKDKVTFSSFNIACEVYYGAKKYILPHLANECVKYLLSVLSPINVCIIYSYAKLFEESELIKKCLLIIRTNTSEVLKSSSWQGVEFSTIMIIFEEDELNLNSESELFSALERWIKEKCKELSETLKAKSLRSVIEDALFLIRFLTFTPEQFAEGPGVSDLLTQDEKFAILMNLCSMKCNVSMPENFCSSRCNRTMTRPIFLKVDSNKVHKLSYRVTRTDGFDYDDY